MDFFEEYFRATPQGLANKRYRSGWDEAFSPADLRRVQYACSVGTGTFRITYEDEALDLTPEGAD